jgi:hypothetical protein
MGEQFTGLLNITLVYPETSEKVLANVMHGRTKKVVIRIETLPVPKVDSEVYFSSPETRVEFQRWLNQLWLEKDQQIDDIIKAYRQQ